MALTITDRMIRSTGTPHTARLSEDCSWRVSWLPFRVLTFKQAVAAMELADEAGAIPADCDPEIYDEAFWSRVDAWAAELGLTGPDAVVRVSEPPGGVQD